VDHALAQTVETVLANVYAQVGDRAGILEVLLRLDAAIGYEPLERLPRIAHALGVTDAEVAGVLSYYPDLHTQPKGRHVVRVCLGEACLANHGSRVFRAVQDRLRVDAGGTMPGGRCTLEKVYCVGNCGVSPTMVIDDDLYGRVTPDQVPMLLERYR